MDEEKQRDHLKAYGIAYWILENEVNVDWLVNYRGGSFLIKNINEISKMNVHIGELVLKFLVTMKLMKYSKKFLLHLVIWTL